MIAIQDAFRQVRVHAAQHMAACERAGVRWSETSITEIVVSQAARAVTVVPFTQRAEVLSGADWVWWWVDGAGAYGMLVQAKRLTVTASTWSFDFGYTARGAARTQRENLWDAAKTLGLLPAYALHLGTGDYRGWQRCTSAHRGRRCLQCAKRSVSLMPALLAESVVVNDAVSTYERSVALEDLLNPPESAPLIIPVIRDGLAAELADFLMMRQDGTRAVTRAMFDPVLRARYGAFSAAPAVADRARLGGAHDALGRVFGDLPADTGHWGLDYFEHTLNPLRQAPPDYVLEITSGDFTEDHLASGMPDNVAGVVVVQVPGHG